MSDPEQHPSADESHLDEQPITDLDVDAGMSPEDSIAASLQSALRELRADSDALSTTPVDEQRVDAAETIANKAAELDEQIGSIARSEDA